MGDKQTSRRSDKQTSKQANKQTNRQTDKQTRERTAFGKRVRICRFVRSSVRRSFLVAFVVSSVGR